MNISDMISLGCNVFITLWNVGVTIYLIIYVRRNCPPRK